MLISRYSKPDFDPYGDNAPEETDAWWPAPVAARPLAAVVSLPGSKSLTNRELVLAALADAPSLLRSPLHSRDSDLMVAALRQLGTTIESVPGGLVPSSAMISITLGPIASGTEAVQPWLYEAVQ